MIGLLFFATGMVFMAIAQLLNVQFNYDGESSVPMIIWTFIIMLALCMLYILFSIVTFGGQIL